MITNTMVGHVNGMCVFPEYEYSYIAETQLAFIKIGNDLIDINSGEFVRFDWKVTEDVDEEIIEYRMELVPRNIETLPMEIHSWFIPIDVNEMPLVELVKREIVIGLEQVVVVL